MPAPNNSRVSRRRLKLVLALTSAATVVGCQTTSDSLGRNEPTSVGTRHLLPVKGPSSYPSGFRDTGIASDQQIASKIESAFNQLFHGDPGSQAIFFPVGTDEANIQDINHSNEVRTEGMGLAMLIAVELGKQNEFNQLWRYARAEMMESAGPKSGYFKSYCDTSYNDTTPPVRCWDPFGLQLFVMALIFAHDRWPEVSAVSDAGAINYESDAFMLFDTMRLKEQENGGVIEDVTNTFDDPTHLVYNDPTSGRTNFTRPSTEMPAFYELWAQATGDSYWSMAATNARAYWKNAANPSTGMLPVRAYFSGASYPGWDVFAPEGFRTQLNMVLDQIWNGGDPWEVSEADQLIGFFSRYSNQQFPKIYKLDGTVVDPETGDTALIVLNGMSALISTNGNRTSFINAVWNLPVPNGPYRYYGGLLDIIALMVLGGQFRVY